MEPYYMFLVLAVALPLFFCTMEKIGDRPDEPSPLRRCGDPGAIFRRDWTFSAGTLFRAPIRVSYVLLFVFAYQWLSMLVRGCLLPLGWCVLETLGSQLLLVATILCHEFGHGTMARSVGGDIDHILLWIMGGICFSTRPRTVDRKAVLRNDFLIAAAGPATHFPMVAAWAGLLMLLHSAFRLRDAPGVAPSAWGAVLSALFGGSTAEAVTYLDTTTGPGAAVLWSLACHGVFLNVALFLFNVFFPMFPADGSKLLTTGLMFGGGVAPSTAALAFIVVSGFCASLVIGFELWSKFKLFSDPEKLSNLQLLGSWAMMPGLWSMMALMCLAECKKVWDLRQEKRLHTHFLFEVAKSWSVLRRDDLGNFRGVNVEDYDDDTPVVPPCACCGLLRRVDYAEEARLVPG